MKMMKRIVLFILLFVTVVFLAEVPAGLAQSVMPDQSQREVTPGQPGDTKSDSEVTQKNLPADNTGINKRDQSQKELTADQQGETKNDRDITQKIRRAVVANKSLSTYAHNVKIITVDGKVTLKGPVSSEEEKKAIEEIAAGIVGKTNIKNKIGIAPEKADK